MTQPPPPPKPRLSRRRLLGGALTAALTAALVPRDQSRPTPRGDRWHGRTRWIGHA
jgi:hypothetical protein